jgi:hypothetical protein
MPAPKIFVIRVWYEPSGEDQSVWRASVTDTRTQERRYFQHPDDLTRFLNRSLEAHPPPTQL